MCMSLFCKCVCICVFMCRECLGRVREGCLVGYVYLLRLEVYVHKCACEDLKEMKIVCVSVCMSNIETGKA